MHLKKEASRTQPEPQRHRQKREIVEKAKMQTEIEIDFSKKQMDKLNNEIEIINSEKEK